MKTDKKRVLIKPVIAVAAAISTLLAGGLAANAATDGKIAEKAKEIFIKTEPVSEDAPASVKVLDDGQSVEESQYQVETYEKDGKMILKIKTEHGYMTEEMPLEEFEKNGFDGTFSSATYVDENGTHEETIFVGDGTNVPTTVAAN